MMVVHVSRARRAGQQLLALVALVAAGRFAYVGFERWDAQRQPIAAAAPLPVPELLPGPAPAAGFPAPPPAPPGELITVVLTVSHGNHRSEVFLDDSPLGHTVFVGQAPCRKGSDVTIRIKPKRGSPIDHVERCDGSDIVIHER
jgi:hypothetical protein